MSAKNPPYEAMLLVLIDLSDSLDAQTYDERVKKEDGFDAPDDREYEVHITAKQLRAIDAALELAHAR